MLSDVTHGMALNTIIGQITLHGNPLPPKTLTVDNNTHTMLGCSPSSRRANTITIHNNMIILSSILIAHSRIFLLDQVLLAQLKNKLIRLIGS